MITSIYCELHKRAKQLLRKNLNPSKNFMFIDMTNDCLNDYLVIENNTSNSLFINDCEYDNNPIKIEKSSLYYGENTFSNNAKLNIPPKRFIKSIEFQKPEEAWIYMLENSIVPEGWRNSGFSQTGYILEKQQWCLSSWIWTSAASARSFCKLGKIELAQTIADAFIREQLEDGGWLVRNDYSNSKVKPIVAPNDSAYIAKNALLSVYYLTKNQSYLNNAERTANWIISTAQSNGLVYFGYDKLTGEWIENVNIVDIGFTAGLFADLYKITNKKEYLQFMNNFITAYINTFYDKSVGLFSTAINENKEQFGGYFGRGQAWALEGLIPAYKVTKSNEIKVVIDQTVMSIINNQLKNGAWPYNFKSKLMGTDCKGTSVIASSLMEWYKLFPSETLYNSIIKSINWCKKNTCLQGEASGGIFSKSVEGAVVHNLYSSTAFVYSTAYAIEVLLEIEKIKMNNKN